MKDFVHFITENWKVIVSALIPVIWVIVRLTPTKKDDFILKILVKILELFIPDIKKGGGKFKIFNKKQKK